MAKEASANLYQSCLKLFSDQFNYSFLSNNFSLKFENASYSLCALDVPTATELFKDLPTVIIVACVLLLLCTIVTWIIYFEEVYFTFKKFKIISRRSKTIWVLAFFPVFSTTGILGVFIPRAGPLVDMVANVFFGTCLYNFGQLMINYMGGPVKMWELIEVNRKLKLNTPPICCCCVCLPKIQFNRRSFFRISLQIMQVAIVRTVVMFIAAVMWADGLYKPGDTSLSNGFIYVAFINLISTMIAVYGLMLLRGILAPELQPQFSITGKILVIQITLLSSVIPNLIIGFLVTNDVIACGTILPSKGRGEVLYHAIIVMLMLPYSLLGRKFYRRAGDGDGYASLSYVKPRTLI